MCRLAFQLSDKIAYHIRSKIKKAGKDWLIGFLSRDKQLSIRTLEATSASRVHGFNKNGCWKVL